MSDKVKVNREYLGGNLEELRQELSAHREFRVGWKLYEMAAEIGRLVSLMRANAKLTQSQLASLLGVGQPVVARLESRHPERIPTFATLAKVAEACGYEMEVVFRPKEERSYLSEERALRIRSETYLQDAE